MARFTQEQLEEILGKGNVKLATGSQRCRTRGELQELQADREEEKRASVSHHRSKEEKADGSDDPQFCVSIKILVSDKRDRDGDGITSTLFDCLVSAVGRFAQVDSRDMRKYANSFKRERRNKQR